MKIYLLIIFIFLLVTRPILGQSKIFINEFLIDPQPQSVEIFNSGTESVDISNWIIDDSGGTTFFTIPKNNIIFPNQCLVFSADFNLNKTSADIVRLINGSQQLVDSFSYKSSSGSGISYFRFPDGSKDWATGSATLGFYNQTNMSCLVTPTPTLMFTPTPFPTPAPIQPTPTNLADLTVSPTPSPSLYKNVYLSEVMVNPTTGEKEWVEIYNDNDFSISLKNWYVDDLENAGSSPKIFSLEISGKSYGVHNLTSSMFNNDGDSVRLLDFNKSLKDDFEYQKTEQGKSFGRASFDSDNFCLQEPSKNFVNNPCINPTLIIIATTEKILFPSSTKSIPSGIKVTKDSNFDVSIHRTINYPTGVINSNNNRGVLGLTDKLIINSSNNKSLINLLSILSFSYSLLTISSILFKIKLSYGKDKKFYSPSLHSS